MENSKRRFTSNIDTWPISDVSAAPVAQSPVARPLPTDRTANAVASTDHRSDGLLGAHSARHGQPRPPTTYRNRNLGVAPTIDLRAPGLAANSLPPRIRLLLVPADRGVAVRGVAAPRSGRAAPLRGPRGSRPTTPIRTPSTHSPTRHPAQGRSTLRPAAVGTPRPRLEGASPPCAVSVAPSSETPSSAALWPRAAARHRTRRHPLDGPHPLRFTWTGSSLRRMFGARLAGTPQLTSTRRDCPRTPPAARSAHPVSVSVRARLSIAVSCVGLLCGSPVWVSRCGDRCGSLGAGIGAGIGADGPSPRVPGRRHRPTCRCRDRYAAARTARHRPIDMPLPRGAVRHDRHPHPAHRPSSPSPATSRPTGPHSSTSIPRGGQSRVTAPVPGSHAPTPAVPVSRETGTPAVGHRGVADRHRGLSHTQKRPAGNRRAASVGSVAITRGRPPRAAWAPRPRSRS
ncbi:hypothetical protein LY15_002399 [Prauserella flava]|nr:hypothetical protein [Prauserella flava]MCR3733866.1 hypothetical protein [Prauserella salsuginis]